jgi:hypothetical protein
MKRKKKAQELKSTRVSLLTDNMQRSSYSVSFLSFRIQMVTYLSMFFFMEPFDA